MNSAHHPNPTEAQAAGDAWIERLLKDDATRLSAPADAGFSSQVMTRLPARRRSPGRSPVLWLTPLMTLIGCVLATWFTPAARYVASGLVQVLQYHHFSAANLLALIPVAMLYFICFSSVREN